MELALRGQQGRPVGQLRPEGTEVEGVLPEAGSSSTDNEGLSVTQDEKLEREKVLRTPAGLSGEEDMNKTTNLIRGSLRGTLALAGSWLEVGSTG